MTKNFQTIIKDLEVKLGDYRYDNEIEITKAKLETAKQLKEIVEKTIKEIYDYKIKEEYAPYQNCIQLYNFIGELRKSLGVEKK